MSYMPQIHTNKIKTQTEHHIFINTVCGKSQNIRWTEMLDSDNICKGFYHF